MQGCGEMGLGSPHRGDGVWDVYSPKKCGKRGLAWSLPTFGGPGIWLPPPQGFVGFGFGLIPAKKKKQCGAEVRLSPSKILVDLGCPVQRPCGAEVWINPPL